jgi:hypothetical protein
MAELLLFKAPDDDAEAVIEIIEDILEKARRGEVSDIAIAAAIRDKDGPQQWHSYYGQGAYSVLVSGIASLAFAVQYDARKEHEASF